MKITVIGISGTRDAIKKFKEQLPRRIQELVDRLAELGYQYADAQYSFAPDAGVNDVRVTVRPDGRCRAAIVAGGTATMFIEFGTGVLQADSPEARQELKSSSGLKDHGGYGQHRAKSLKGWSYRGTAGVNPPAGTEPSTKIPGLIHTYGQPANPVMYRARKEIEHEIEDVVREVFSK